MKFIIKDIKLYNKMSIYIISKINLLKTTVAWMLLNIQGGIKYDSTTQYGCS